MEDVNIEEGRGFRGRRCNLWIIGGFLFVAAAVGAGVVLALFLTKFTQEQYGLVFDAGSSHSDVSLFRWPGAKLKGTGDVLEVTRCDAKGGGISDYVAEPQKAADSLKDCLSASIKKVPEKLRAVTPVYLGATAGMRLLGKEDATRILDAIGNLFSSSELDYTPGGARIISDQEEASFAWITVNLLLRLLGQTGERVETSGTLDLGGASTQIAFETSERAKNPQDADYQQLRLFGYDFSIYAHSYLCWGTDQAALRYRTILLMKAGSKQTSIDDPCFNTGNEEVKTADKIFGQTCTVPMPDYYAPTDEIKFIGKSDPGRCSEIIKEQFNVTACTKMFKGKYCFDASVIPEVQGNFVAISSFYYVTSFLGITDADLDGFRATANRHCLRTLDEVKVMKGQDIKYSKSFCYNVQYQLHILEKVYGFNTNEKFKQLRFLRNIDGVTTGWALGFMANATNAIPTETVTPIHQHVFVALFIVFIVILIILSIVGFRVWQRKRSRSSTISSGPREATCLGLCCPYK